MMGEKAASKSPPPGQQTPKEGVPNSQMVESQMVEGKRPWRILIVDDNADIVTVIRRILVGQGYATLEAFNGREALERAREHRPDVILLDWMLPELDGLEVCRRLKKARETRNIMILLVTGRGSIANRIQGFNAGADDYIPKPFNHTELLARVRSALRVKQLTDSLSERNRQLVHSQQELVRKEKMATIGLLASGIAHEFNNIMAGISGYAQLARTNAKYVPRLIEVALTQAERAMELTRSLSSYNRQSSEPSACDVNTVIDSALWLVKKQVEHKSINLQKRIDKVPRAAIKPGQLQEVVLNLVINAIHAVPPQGTISVEVKSDPSSERVVIRVKDAGEGIPPENLARIFDPFFTTKGALGGGKQQGSGLGLSVCYNVVQACGGNIYVESEVGKGSMFTVTLPAHGAPAEAAPEPPALLAAALAAAPSPTRQKILVVDDEEHIRNMLREFLQEQHVVCCSSGEEAVNEYQKDSFDYVLLDICMQNSFNGIDTMKKLKEIDPDAKVVLSSGRLPEEIGKDALEEAYGHLLKPYKFEELSSILGIS